MTYEALVEPYNIYRDEPDKEKWSITKFEDLRKVMDKIDDFVKKYQKKE